ncbi:MAG: acyltransferase family protein [Thermoleophilia bacterium]
MAVSTRQTTSYLKGLVILLVLITHYTSAYASGVYNLLIRDYAGLVVSVFFILSGFGNYYSMQRLETRYGGKPLSLRLIGTFFWQRALRIYPLYWLSLWSASLILVTGWVDLQSFSLRTVGTYMAFPTIRPPGYAWFIPELVQCYLAAPLLYYLLRKLRQWRFVAFILALGAVFMVVSLYYSRILDLINGSGIPDPPALIYRTMFLGNVLLFAFGLCMPLLVRQVKPYVNNYVTLAFLIAFFVSLYLVRDEYFLLARLSSQLWLFPLYLFSVSGLCLSAIAANRVLPLSRAIAYLGGYSLTIYLFHWQYYVLLEKVGLINSSELWSAAATITLFPVFLMECVALQKSATELRMWLDRPAPVETPAAASARNKQV